ncbi:MAG: hypothetical protein H3C31_00820 [Brumimicrobium sp.]|nr:hypothetical protein [Brumimicrobium sp.]MCO5268184.1 hypothetical protein [Brumimicrobium sp.]
MRLLLFILGFLLIFPIQQGKAQAFLTNPFGASYWQPKFGFSGATFFHNKDFILDFGVGYDELGYDFTVTFNGAFRPYQKTILFEESDKLFIQTKEKVYQFSIDLEKRFNFLEFGDGNKLGLYALGKFSFFWGRYRGFYNSHNQKFIIHPSGGFQAEFKKAFRIYAGYLYFNTIPSASPHMAVIKLNFAIGKNRDE